MMSYVSGRRRTRLLASSVSVGLALTGSALASPAFAQDRARDAQQIDEVVVTGSRIKRLETATEAPVSVIGQDDILQRGYTQVGQALNTVPSIRPSVPATLGDGSSPGAGRQFPNLFNLGPGRTLSLVNGRRTAASSSGLGDRVVDTNLIPTGLLQRIDIVEAGGAAVYGSDAIAGVVNYILKEEFSGLELDAQYGDSSRSDYPRPALRLTAGRNFDDGRGNMALNVEWSKTDPLLYNNKRPILDPVYRLASNPFNTGPADGIPSTIPYVDPHFWVYNDAGVIFTARAPSIAAIAGQFSRDGTGVAPFNAGRPYAPPFPCAPVLCQGGDGLPYSRNVALMTGVETYSGTAIGHYDLTEDMKVSGELLYARNQGRNPLGALPGITAFGGANQAPIPFTRSNPFLTAGQIASLSALSPSFASGGTLFLAKAFEDLLPTREAVNTTDTYRGVIALDGDFEAAGRTFNYSAFYSRSVVKGRTDVYGVVTSRFYNAANAVRNASGAIVCGINADAVTTNDDPLCAPMNAFGLGNISPAARAYITTPNDSSFYNTQDDFLLSLGGDLIRLPAGAAKFNVAYEHREESAKNTPSIGAQLGIIGSGAVTAPTSGHFKTDELSAEVLVPILGGDVRLPFVEALELSGQFRWVDNSLAGRENVWAVGGRWNVGYGLTFRASRSRNFRAPSLDQLVGLRSTALGGAILDPCDARLQNSGPNPAVRLANCRALFAANPQWGPLATFTNASFNQPVALITTGGNPTLKNELSDTTTFGLVWQPSYIPGALTLVVDRIQIDLEHGLTPFTPTNFSQACFDASPMPDDICGTFTRDRATGSIVSALNTTFNAAKVIYRGEVYSLTYRFPLSWVTPWEDAGSLELSGDATHNENLKTVVAGARTQQAGTTVAPRWVFRGNARYTRGPLGISYELYYLPTSRLNVFDTIETTPFPTVESNTRHSVSATYDFGRYQVRGGVNNLTDRGPSFSTNLDYGDLIGRQWFVGLRARF